MAEPMPGGAQMQAPPAAPGGGGQGADGAAPFGQSPVTGPTPDKGMQAAALQRAGIISKMLMDLLNMAGPSGDIGKDAMKCLQIINKHLPSGSVTPAGERNQLDKMQMQNTQQNSQMQALKQGQGQPPGAPGAQKPPAPPAQPGMAA